MSESTKPTCLVLFDFDHTLIDANSDVIAIELLQNDEQREKIYGYRHKLKWIDNMIQCFSMLHEQGLTADDILGHIRKLPLNDGMRELVSHLWQHSATSAYRFELAIVSDANTLFIDAILREQGILAAFDGRIHTNEVMVSDGKLVEPTSKNAPLDTNNAAPNCDWCGSNLCKSSILRRLYVDAQRTQFAKLIYVGDGENDCCPMRLLSDEDSAFVRRGYRAEKLIANNDRGIAKAIRAPITYWSSGLEIRDALVKNHVL